MTARPSHLTQSTSRPSTISAGQQGSSSGASRLQAKRQELEGLQILKEQSARLAKDVEKLSQGVDQLVGGGEAVANVMASWAGVFRAIQIARDSTALPTDTDQDFEGSTVRAIPETMVRLPVQSNTLESDISEVDVTAR
ncbi:hypothetical protein CBS101457_004317 [Exobasidium rhododendri]|nr:hypothetical protein CBS101457_004317 [Exobasidium rhododendri]